MRRFFLSLIGLAVMAGSVLLAAPAQAYTYSYATSQYIPCYWVNSTGYVWVKWTIVYRSDNRRKIDTVYVAESNTPTSFNRLAAHQEVAADGRWIGSGFNSSFPYTYNKVFGPTSDTAMGWYSNGSVMELHASVYVGSTDYCSILHTY